MDAPASLKGRFRFFIGSLSELERGDGERDGRLAQILRSKPEGNLKQNGARELPGYGQRPGRHSVQQPVID
ncbi:hypothetical protein P0D87_19585 [Paraburkholderia sp. RL17-368-BIF-A]|jgi:hypothetical protein